jgi:hypothetical protein
MISERIPSTHYELHYLISEVTALNIRDFIQTHLELDELSIGRPEFSFPVHTVYLDSPDLALYWRAISDRGQQIELRLRLESREPVYVEIKRRLKAVVLRERCTLRAEAIEILLTGQLPGNAYLANPTPANLVMLQHFLKLKETFQANPRMQMAFMREAYISCDEKARLTFDRNIVCQAGSEASFPLKLNCPIPVFHGAVVLKLNFPDRYPNWFQELVERFSLGECEAEKFVTGMSAIGSKLSGPPAN